MENKKFLRLIFAILMFLGDFRKIFLKFLKNILLLYEYNTTKN